MGWKHSLDIFLHKVHAGEDQEVGERTLPLHPISVLLWVLKLAKDPQGAISAFSH